VQNPNYHPITVCCVLQGHRVLYKNGKMLEVKAAATAAVPHDFIIPRWFYHKKRQQRKRGFALVSNLDCCPSPRLQDQNAKRV